MRFKNARVPIAHENFDSDKVTEICASTGMLPHSHLPEEEYGPFRKHTGYACTAASEMSSITPA